MEFQTIEREKNMPIYLRVATTIMTTGRGSSGGGGGDGDRGPNEKYIANNIGVNYINFNVKCSHKWL